MNILKKYKRNLPKKSENNHPALKMSIHKELSRHNFHSVKVAFFLK